MGLEGGDVAASGAFAHGERELIEGGAGAAGHGLDGAAIGKVADVAGEAEGAGAGLHEQAEADALHAAGDDESPPFDGAGRHGLPLAAAGASAGRIALLAAKDTGPEGVAQALVGAGGVVITDLPGIGAAVARFLVRGREA